MLVLLLFIAAVPQSQENTMVVAADISTTSTTIAHRGLRVWRESTKNLEITSYPQEESAWLTRARKLFGGGPTTVPNPTANPTTSPSSGPTSSTYSPTGPTTSPTASPTASLSAGPTDSPTRALHQDQRLLQCLLLVKVLLVLQFSLSGYRAYLGRH
jgi:hypothetical protein